MVHETIKVESQLLATTCEEILSWKYPLPNSNGGKWKLKTFSVIQPHLGNGSWVT